MSDERDEIIKVTDAETLEWIGNLDEASRVELKRRALEKRAVELLQPPAAPPDVSRMDDQEFARYKRSLGIG
jgi:hypothetical protein